MQSFQCQTLADITQQGGLELKCGRGWRMRLQTFSHMNLKNINYTRFSALQSYPVRNKTSKMYCKFEVCMHTSSYI
jgi:hypothetical protein